MNTTYCLMILTGGGGVGGVNPKINNMLQGYKFAKYDLLWINDSSLFGMFHIENPGSEYFVAFCKQVLVLL